MIAIRKARPSENAFLAEFGARTFAENFAAQNTPENMSAYLAEAFNPNKQAQELADPAGVFLLAEIEGELAGYAHLYAGPLDIDTYEEAGASARQDALLNALQQGRCPIELVRIYADSAWIGKGVGPALMQACLDEVRTRGSDLIWLGVWENNPRAQAFYQKWGFDMIGTHTFRLGDDLQTDWVMARLID